MLLTEVGVGSKTPVSPQHQTFLMLLGAQEMCSERFLSNSANRVDETEGLSNAELRKIAKELSTWTK
jgi:hypothetical protein